jgi:hypothetical protein
VSTQCLDFGENREEEGILRLTTFLEVVKISINNRLGGKYCHAFSLIKPKASKGLKIGLGEFRTKKREIHHVSKGNEVDFRKIHSKD